MTRVTIRDQAGEENTADDTEEVAGQGCIRGVETDPVQVDQPADSEGEKAAARHAVEDEKCKEQQHGRRHQQGQPGRRFSVFRRGIRLAFLADKHVAPERHGGEDE